MNIVIESSYNTIGRGGISRYINCLYQSLIKHHPELSVKLLDCGFSNYGKTQPFRACKTLFREYVYEKLLCRSKIQKLNSDLVHLPFRYSIPFRKRVKRVSTLHDLGYFRNPERFRPWTIYSGINDLKMIHKSDKIICVSSFTASEAMELLNISAKKIEVVHHGSTYTEVFPIEASKPFLLNYKKFFLFVSSIEPGKNLKLLREIYLEANKQKVDLYPLVVVGERFHGFESEGDSLPNWMYTGRINDQELLWLYKNASALIYPSQYEGFGMPLLEAMSQSCPVICSPVASLKEVGGDAALYADYKVFDYLDKMKYLITHDSNLGSIKSRSFHHSQKFSWKKCSTETAQIYLNC